MTMDINFITEAEYQRRQRNTTPKKLVLTEEQISRYQRRVMKGQPNECWPFRAKTKDKYPRFQGKLTHRISYFIYKGEIPEGLTIDHLCQNTWCQNPDHLEAVSVLENSKRYIQTKRGERKWQPAAN